MRVYNVYNDIIESPELNTGSYFGSGFYVWADLDKARAQGTKYINVFEFSLNGSIKFLEYDDYPLEWFIFMDKNRMGELTREYDVVLGPELSDELALNFLNYEAGVYCLYYVKERLKKHEEQSLISFYTEAGLKALKYVESIVVDERD